MPLRSPRPSSACWVRSASQSGLNSWKAADSSHDCDPAGLRTRRWKWLTTDSARGTGASRTIRCVFCITARSLRRAGRTGSSTPIRKEILFWRSAPAEPSSGSARLSTERIQEIVWRDQPWAYIFFVNQAVGASAALRGATAPPNEVVHFRDAGLDPEIPAQSPPESTSPGRRFVSEFRALMEESVAMRTAAAPTDADLAALHGQAETTTGAPSPSAPATRSEQSAVFLRGHIVTGVDDPLLTDGGLYIRPGRNGAGRGVLVGNLACR